MTPAVSSRPARWMAYLRLFRAPNSFTAIADVAMAYLVTAPAPLPRLPGIILACATVLMYTAGMVLNDVFDYEIDREERPQRPLPAGQISVSWARWLGWEMLLVGAALAWLTGLLAGDRDASWWRPGVIGSLLAACIVLYDGGLRRTFVGPLVMGACRFWNVLMGMSLYAAPSGTTSVAGFDPSHVCIAGGIGLYIVGVTVFSRSEATQSPRGGLLFGLLLITGGLTLLAAFPSWFPQSFSYRLEPTTTWPLALLVVSIWVLRRCVLAISRPDPPHVQAAVKLCILSLILFDATLCLLLCPLAYGLGILALLAPALWLGRWVYST